MRPYDQIWNRTRAMLWEVLQSNDELAQQVAFLKRALWGKKSEKHVSEDQFDLFEEVKKRLGLTKKDDDSDSDSPARMPKDKAKPPPVQTTHIGLAILLDLEQRRAHRLATWVVMDAG